MQTNRGGLRVCCSLQYFSEEDAQALGGQAATTGGINLAMDYVPVMLGYENCQVIVTNNELSSVFVPSRGNAAVGDSD